MHPDAVEPTGLKLEYDMETHSCMMLCGNEIVLIDSRTLVWDTYGEAAQNELIKEAVTRFTARNRW